MEECYFSKVAGCNFTKINTPPWVFFTFFELYKWHQITQRTTYDNKNRTDKFEEKNSAKLK